MYFRKAIYMTSVINSEQVKNAVLTAMNNVLETCAEQQNANGLPYEGFDSNEEGLLTSIGLVEPSAEMKEFSNAKPTQVKITVEFYFGEETHQDKHGKLLCQPVIDLTNIV
jgi:hypothetical protein